MRRQIYFSTIENVLCAFMIVSRYVKDNYRKSSVKTNKPKGYAQEIKI